MLFGKYRLIRKLAVGGMAEIYLARQEGMEGFRKDVAVKRILPVHADNDELIEMFLDEARIAATLNHPNVVQIYDLGKSEGDFFIAMEYVHGQDLRRTCERGLAVGNFLPLRHAVRIIADAAAGLHYAHTQVDGSGNALNIVHRDVSPQNIIISFDGVVKVLDFGIAKAENKINSTRTGQLKGKFAYMSPEQCDGEDIDARSDIFALGTLLYEITLCRRLFKGDTDMQTLKRVSQADVPLPTTIQPEYPKDLEAILLKTLARDPDDRYQSARELQRALEDFLSDNRMKTGPLQMSEYLREIFPDKLERPGEDPAFLAKHSDSNAIAGSDPLGLSLSELAQPSAPKPAEPPQSHKRPSGPPGGGPPGRPPHGGRPPGPPGGPPGRRPPGPPGGPGRKLPQAKDNTPQGAVSLVVNPNSPFKHDQPIVDAPEKQKRRRVVSSSSRSSVKGAEYRLRSENDGDLDEYEKGSRIYYGFLAVFACILLAGAAWLIYSKGSPFAGSGAFDVNLDNEKPDVALGPPPAPLKKVAMNLKTTPAGAHVIVNGMLREGETPGEFEVVPGKTNTVSFYRSKFKTVHFPVEVPETAAPDPFELSLSPFRQPNAPKPKEEDKDAKTRKRPKKDTKKEETEVVYKMGKVSINSEPEGADVYLDGRLVGPTPIEISDVIAFQEHHFAVRLKGYHDVVLTRVILPDIVNPIDLVQLDPLVLDTAKRSTRMTIEPIPPEASITVGGDPKGIRSWTGNVGRNEVLKVEVKAPNYHPYEQYIATEASTIRLNPQLEKIVREPGELTLKVIPSKTTLYIGPNEEEKVEKKSLQAGKHTITLVKPDGTRGRVKVEVVGGQHSEYTIDFSGPEPKLK